MKVWLIGSVEIDVLEYSDLAARLPYAKEIAAGNELLKEILHATKKIGFMNILRSKGILIQVLNIP